MPDESNVPTPTPTPTPTPDPSEIRDHLKEAEDLSRKISEDIKNAQSINDDATSDIPPDRVSLDNTPFGEEVIRLREADEQLQEAKSILKSALENPKNASSTQISHAIGLVEEAGDTSRDCGPIPKVDNEDGF